MARFWTLLLEVEEACVLPRKPEFLAADMHVHQQCPGLGYLAVDSGVCCLGFRSCIQQHAELCVSTRSLLKEPPHLKLDASYIQPTKKQTAQFTVHFGISYLGAIWKTKQKVNNKHIHKIWSPKIARKKVMMCEVSSHCLYFNRFPGPALFASQVSATNVLLYYYQVHLLPLCKQILRHICFSPRTFILIFFLFASNYCNTIFALSTL